MLVEIQLECAKYTIVTMGTLKRYRVRGACNQYDARLHCFLPSKYPNKSTTYCHGKSDA